MGGFSNNIEEVWREHHALVLPSRFEGNALAMIEAMLCGRMPIVTDVGRVTELVDDNRSGFIAPAATAELIDDALERAWQRRHEWQQMGAIAAADIRHRHSLRPAGRLRRSHPRRHPRPADNLPSGGGLRLNRQGRQDAQGRRF